MSPQSDSPPRMAPPRKRPNNVHSQVDPGHPAFLPPYDGGDDPAATFARLKDIVRGLPRCTVEVDEPTYLRAVTRSRFFRFPDINEFALEGDVIHVKCAAVLGYRDFDVNRTRAEEIRALLGA
jgi:uncharacterized protein (DUF1499 family)